MVLQTVSLINQAVPHLCLNKQRCFIINNNNQGHFFDKNVGAKNTLMFDLDRRPPKYSERGAIV
jgi:hypothetical protein